LLSLVVEAAVAEPLVIMEQQAAAQVVLELIQDYPYLLVLQLP
jgi:hypothetical protein